MKIYIEKLTLTIFLIYILPNYNKIRKKEIIYFSKHRYLSFLIFFCKKINFLNFTKYNLVSDFYLDKNNECLLSSIFRNDLNNFKKFLINQKIFDFVKKNFDQNFYNYFLKNNHWGYDYLSAPVTLLLINKVYIHNNTKDKKILILKNRKFELFYNKYAHEKKIKLKYLLIFETKDIYRFFFNKNKAYIIIIYFYLKNILKNFNIFFRYKEFDKKYYITHSTTGEFNLHKNFYNSESFFFNYSKLKKNYFKYNSVDKTKIKNLKKNNFKVCNSNTYENHFSKFFYSKLYDNINLNNNFFVYQKNKDYWSNFFYQNKIKVYLDWNTYNSNSFIINESLKINDGIYCLWEKSFTNFVTPQTSNSSDILFKYCSFLIKKKNHPLIDYVIDLGFLRDYGTKYIKRLSNSIRKKLKDRGVKLIISLFDQNSKDEYSIYILNKNYNLILKKAFTNPQLGIIIKPKKINNLFKNLSKDNKYLLKNLIDSGRCYIFTSSGTHQSNIPVSVASYASDLCIHSSLKACTAAIESAMSNVPTIIIDAEGYPENVIESSLPENIIYRDYVKINDLIDDFVKNSKVNKSVGQWGDILHDLDTYKDGQASVRMGELFNWMIKDFNLGLNKDKVIDNTINRFADKWGHQKIYH